MKKKAQKNRKSQVQFAPLIPNAVSLGIKEVDRLLAQYELDEALDKLTDLEFRYPGHLPVLQRLLTIGAELEDANAVIVAAEGLLQLGDGDPFTLFALTSAYLETEYIFLTLESGRRLTEIVVDDDAADDLAGHLAQLEAGLKTMLESAGFGAGEDGFSTAVLLDRARLRLSQSRYPETRSICEHILATRPDLLPAFNMMARAYFYEDSLGDAIAVTERALASMPADIDTLANAVRYYMIAGRVESALAAAKRLKAAPPEDVIETLQVMTALTYVGDDEGVLEAFAALYPDVAAVPAPEETASGALSGPIIFPDLPDEISEEPGDDDEGAFDGEFDSIAAATHHFAAVALARLGLKDEAARLWDLALELDPELEIAEDNRKDLALPQAERNGPWPFPMSDWIPQASSNAITETMESGAPKRPDTQVSLAILDDVLRRHPSLETAAAPLLDRGDRVGRMFMMMLSRWSNSEVIREAVLAFALGQRGSDNYRKLAAIASLHSGTIPAGPIRLWVDGEWKEVDLPLD